MRSRVEEDLGPDLKHPGPRGLLLVEEGREESVRVEVLRLRSPLFLSLSVFSSCLVQLCVEVRYVHCISLLTPLSRYSCLIVQAEYFLTSPVQSLTIGEVSQLLALFQETWEEKLRLEQEVRRLRAYGDQQKETGNGLGRDGGEEKEKEKGRDMSVENFMTSKSPSPSLI